MTTRCKVAADPTGATPLWECACPECRALEAELNATLGIEPFEEDVRDVAARELDEIRSANQEGTP